jgi:hypothetical protein
MVVQQDAQVAYRFNPSRPSHTRIGRIPAPDAMQRRRVVLRLVSEASWIPQTRFQRENGNGD